MNGYNLTSSPPTYSFLNDVAAFTRDTMAYIQDITAECLECKYGFTLLPLDATSSSASLSPALDAMFTDIMDDTGDPAVAWQALMTSVLRNAYYNWLSIFSVSGNITTTHMVPCQRPVRKFGFYVVMAVLGTHLLLVVGVCVWFYATTSYTMMGDVWQVVEQLRNPEVDELLAHVSTVDDHVVESAIKASDQLRKRRVRLYSPMAADESLQSETVGRIRRDANGRGFGLLMGSLENA